MTLMRARGEASKWGNDPRAEARWASVDALVAVLLPDCLSDYGHGAQLKKALDDFWYSAYEAALDEAKDCMREELSDHSRCEHDTP